MWYIDADNDGYGDENDTATASTVQPMGYVANNSDCDDTDVAINVDAIELNNDQVDSDCDGALSKAPFIIGNVGPAGGVIFQTDGSNGLEAAPEDQDVLANAEWGCLSIDIVGANNLVIGSGSQNTDDILAANCTPNIEGNPLAANLASDYSLNGYDDWFLPSKDELNAMHVQKAVIGGFSIYYYWSSSEDISANSWIQRFNDGVQLSEAKNATHNVRAIRVF